LGKKLSIVLISSSGALQGDAGVSIYSLSKHALNGLVRCLSLEYGRFGVHINIVALGVMDGGISSDVPPSRLKSMLDRTANRSVVTPTDLAQTVKLLFLNHGINGSTVYCDGGYF
jgi:NAD(P)-dependent dehydrogenase (short-subunit alcohol dehydrogenase family)